VSQDIGISLKETWKSFKQNIASQLSNLKTDNKYGFSYSNTYMQQEADVWYCDLKTTNFMNMYMYSLFIYLFIYNVLNDTVSNSE
jgi:hypothetical protein